MNDEQTQTPEPPTSTPAPVITSLPNAAPKPKKNLPLTKILIALTYVILFAFVGFGFYLNNRSQQEAVDASVRAADAERQLEAKEKELTELKNTTGEVNVNKDGFQGVFLKSGPVYFGKITKITDSQLTLENIYYLRVNGKEKVDIDTPGNDVSLVKLGNELHGPEDVMHIERRNVDFWENLKPDSQVVEAIRTYEAQN